MLFIGNPPEMFSHYDTAEHLQRCQINNSVIILMPFYVIILHGITNVDNGINDTVKVNWLLLLYLAASAL